MTQFNIAGYEIVRQVGGDAASLLYRARRLASEQGTEHLVFLRVFNHPLPAARYEQSLQWAMKAAAPLSHPGVLHIVDWGSTDDEEPYLVIEHATGQPLTTHFRDEPAEGPSNPQDALTLVYHLALILEAALKQGVVHRDLQPDQILVAPQDGEQADEMPVALMGLDLPYALATLGHDQDAPQSRYPSPEQKQGKALDARSNIYSLTMLLYDLLGGQKARAAPPDALPALDTLAPHISEATHELVRRGLQPELWKRYHNYSHFMEALMEAIIAEGGDVEALPAPPVEAEPLVEAEPPDAPPAKVDPTLTLPPALRIALAQVGLLVILLVGSFLLLRNRDVQETSVGGPSPAEPAPSGIFTGVQWTATPSPTTTPVAPVTATLIATTAAAPLMPLTPSATPSPSPTPTEPAATVTPSPSPSPTPTTTATSLPPPPPTATSEPPPPPPPPTATSQPPPPPPPPPPTATSVPPTPTVAPTATESAPTPTPPSPVEDAASHLISGGSQGA
ncbi:MAG TPA: protein kinase [Candidatus Sulfomarinibacteraceae bacterium]|nr:protein kinase [Candidatus Sulfomarinibacteraceae bacterium]